MVGVVPFDPAAPWVGVASKLSSNPSPSASLPDNTFAPVFGCDSTMSKIPSPSESKSKELIIPSPSKSLPDTQGFAVNTTSSI